MSKKMNLLKSLSARLPDGRFVLVAYLYHSNKSDRTQNQYRYDVLVASESFLREKIAWQKMHPEDGFWWPETDGFEIFYGKIPGGSRGAKWLEARIEKAGDFENDLLAESRKVRNGIPSDGFRNSESGEVVPLARIAEFPGDFVFFSRSKTRADKVPVKLD